VNVYEDLGQVVRDDIQRHLIDARRRRDQRATDVLRSLLAAIDNAGAVPAAQRYDFARPALGETEVPRRRLDAAELRRLLHAEAAERRTAAATLRHVGVTDLADDLERDAEMVLHYLDLLGGARTAGSLADPRLARPRASGGPAEPR
jgi:uncharacterized protein